VVIGIIAILSLTACTIFSAKQRKAHSIALRQRARPAVITMIMPVENGDFNRRSEADYRRRRVYLQEGTQLVPVLPMRSDERREGETTERMHRERIEEVDRAWVTAER